MLHALFFGIALAGALSDRPTRIEDIFNLELAVRPADLARRDAGRLRPAVRRHHDGPEAIESLDRELRRQGPSALDHGELQRHLAALVSRWDPDRVHLRPRRLAPDLPALDGQRTDGQALELDLRARRESPGRRTASGSPLPRSFPRRRRPCQGMPTRPEGATWAEPARVIDQLVYRFNGPGYLKPGYHHVFVLPAEGGTPRQISSGEFPARRRGIPRERGRLDAGQQAPDPLRQPPRELRARAPRHRRVRVLRRRRLGQGADDEKRPRQFAAGVPGRTPDRLPRLRRPLSGIPGDAPLS